MCWQDKKFTTVDDLLQLLMIPTKPDVPVAYRGQPDISLPLLSSLDRLLARDMRYEYRLAEETAIIVKFCQLAKEFCDDTEKEYLQGPIPQDRIKALPILQHYGAPTRLVDWTCLPLVALYFASICEHDKDGAVWWFDQNAFQHEVGRRWDNYGLKTYPALNGEVNLNDTAFNTDGPKWIAELHCRVSFHRIKVQQGFFTVAGRLGFDHGELIADVFDPRATSGQIRQTENQYGRIVVPALWKQKILDQLRNMNIHSKRLDYPGADKVGQNLTRELESGFPRK